MAYQGAIINDTSTSSFIPTSDVTRAKVQDETLAGHRRARAGANRISSLAVAATMTLVLPSGTALADDAEFFKQLASQHVNIEYQNALGQDKQTSLSSTNFLSTQDLVSFIRNHVDRSFASDLAKRIEELHTLCLEEGDFQSSISVVSIGGLIELLKSADLAEAPDLVVSYSGNLCAEWYRSAKSKLSVEFLPNGQARYVVFSPDPDFQSRTDKATGVVSVKSLFRALAPFTITESLLA